MRPEPQFHKQETLYSCAPACLKMVMDACGVCVTEAEIIEKCDCDEDGTDYEKLAAAAIAYGFSQSRSEQWGTDSGWGLSQLQELIAKEIYPIVYLKLPPPFPTHAVVVLGFVEEKVRLLDPYHGPRSLLRERFIDEWTLTRQKIIIVE